MTENEKKVFLVAQDITLARLLAGNNKASRDKALKNLKKWFSDRIQTMPFTEEDFQRIWKGLFYSMWMSDKPLVQEECAEKIANLVQFPDLKTSLLFFKSGLSTLINEWFGIDQLRLDKFLMLVRRLLRHIFITIRNHKFNKDNVKLFNDVLSETILNSNMRVDIGLFMHFVEIFLEELAKVSEGTIDQNRVVDMLQPFITKLATTNDGREIGHLRKFIFTYLITQSDLGLEYKIKYNAWKQLGFPGSIDSLQKIKVPNEHETPSNDEENANFNEQKALDPRAGRVDVELPQLKFNAKALANILLEHKFNKASSKKSREMITVLADQFLKLSNGIYPLGIKRILVKKTDDNYDTNVRKAANRLIKFEQKLLGKNKKRTRTKEPEEEAIEPKRKKVAKENRISQETKSDNRNLEGSSQKKESRRKIINDNKEKKIMKSTKILSEYKSNKNSFGASIEDSPVITDHNQRSKSKKSSILKIGEKEAVIKKVKKNLKPKKQSIINNVECVFERNSGTWVVYDISSEKKQKNNPSKIGNQKISSDYTGLQHLVPTNNTTDTSTFLIDERLCNITPSVQSRSKQFETGKTYVKSNNDIPETLLDGLPSTGMDISSLDIDLSSEIDLSPPEKQLYPKFEWEEASQNSPKIIVINRISPNINPLQKIKGKSRLSLDSVIHNSQSKLAKKKLRANSRLSLNPSLVKDPFQTPNKIKRVKINTKLNMSQEFDEHHRLILSSPGIPFDANKKPLKPMLKTPVKLTPINPFYNGSLSKGKFTLL